MIPKEHREFYELDMSTGWETPEGYPEGIKQKILSGSLDEKNKTGSRTRVLTIAPGTYTIDPFVHEYWEEVLLFEGDLRVGNDANGKGGETFKALTYAVRPPGSPHGPVASDNGCTVYEIHYFDPDDRAA
ncbi:MAG: cupin [Alphaproteobacteria bacterium]|nr:cupin [Alphaproteobacteria bacterium]